MWDNQFGMLSFRENNFPKRSAGASLRLLFTMIVLVSLMSAQSPTKPARTIALPPDCQHPFRQLYQYDGGQRLGLKVHSSFCRINTTNGRVRQFGGYGQIDAVTPAPKGRLVAMIHQSSHLVVLNDEARVEFDEDLKSDVWNAIYWTRDQSHLILSDVDDFGTQDAAAIIDLSHKSMKSIRFDPPASVRFDANTSTIRADRGSGKNREGLVYDLKGNLLRHVAPQTLRRSSDSANRKYTYTFRYEIGGGDIIIREAPNGPAVFRLSEHKSLKSHSAVLWDNPDWNPVGDDFLLALYLSDDVANGPGEIDVFSVSQKKAPLVFPVERSQDTPALGWSVDGKQVILCDSACLYYPVP
jgi:hypothetical protein